MAAGKDTRVRRQAVGPPPEPPFYVATATLWFGGAGAMPVADAQPGDRVTPATLAAGPAEWRDLVVTPEQYAGLPPEPPAAPAEPAGVGPGSQEE